MNLTNYTLLLPFLICMILLLYSSRYCVLLPELFFRLEQYITNSRIKYLHCSILWLYTASALGENSIPGHNRTKDKQSNIRINSNIFLFWENGFVSAAIGKIFESYCDEPPIEPTGKFATYFEFHCLSHSLNT